ncbi:glycosyltransferase [Dialister sp.]|uniref:glycosyltransferase n=1 Tax=Dialister sp. TaxID=1955814 RepID=UPI002E80110E|nr:glycosyltransferase [Dialister sp.]MEE3452557.1 glycosyltransferase [Dialister sp.]
MKEKNFVSAVVYARNCETNIKPFLTHICDYLDSNFLNYEVVCVNDASEDKTAEEIKSFASEGHGTVTLLTMSYFQGLELAMDAGVDLAIGDFVYEFDSTILSWGEGLLRKVYDHSLTGFDIVSACPENSGHKEAALFYQLYNKYSRSQYKIRTESFRLLSRRAINRVRAMSRTLPYRKAVYANCGLKTDAIMYAPLCPIPKATDVERTKQKEIAVDALILYTDTFYRLSLGFSIFMMLVAILTGLYTVVLYLTAHPVAGWTTTMLFLAVGFFVLILTLTIAIRYLSLILKTVFTRQKYVVESIDKLS